MNARDVFDEPGARRHLFDLPEGLIYLDGNSLGPLPNAASARVATTVKEEWGQLLIGGWNGAGWMNQPAHLGDRIGTLIGAPPGSVVVGDTLSVKVFQAVGAALGLRPDRRTILSDTGNFPTDLYMAQGLAAFRDDGHTVSLVEPEDVYDAIDDDTAVVLLTHVDYRTGRMHDMDPITRRAHECGALVVWDLAHSAGAVPVDLAGCDADFACGCTYKYLNSGPGGPAFIYVSARLVDHVEPVLAGWLGHAAPFAFEEGYRPGAGIARMRVGTPPIIQMAALSAALEVYDDLSMETLYAHSQTLSELFVNRVEAGCADLHLASPRESGQRGSHVSFRHKAGYAIIQALIAEGVVGDFRAPDMLRFGFAPLYNTVNDVETAADVLCEIVKTRRYDQPQFHARKAVT